MTLWALQWSTHVFFIYLIVWLNIIINNALITSELMIPGEEMGITGNENFPTLIMCHSVEYNSWHQPAGQLIVGNFFFLAVNCKLR